MICTCLQLHFFEIVHKHCDLKYEYGAAFINAVPYFLKMYTQLTCVISESAIIYGFCNKKLTVIRKDTALVFEEKLV